MPRIMIVDDSDVLLREIERFLRADGYDIETAQIGVEAIRKLKESDKVDLILTDYNMPGINGLDMIKSIRAEIEGYEKIPFAVISSEATKGLKEQARELGVVFWVVKPVDPELLRRAINTTLGRALTPDMNE